jgi:hypothetical protein
MKLSNNTHSDFGLSYQTVMNNHSYTIRSGITRPRQLSLGNIPTMSGITDSIGKGWDDRKIAKFFNERNNIVNGQEEVPMTRSKHFEHVYIILSMMTKVKLTTKKGKGNLFTLNAICPPLNLEINQFTSNILQCSKMTSSHSTLRKIWYFPCCISLLLFWNLVNLPNCINFGSRI